MNLKKRIFVYLLILFIGSPAMAQAPAKKFKVVLDAGHGGHDPGCLGSHTKEKDVALDMALRLGKLIEEKCPDVQVIYTRNTDVFVELYRRAQIANSKHADLFISLHCNASEDHIGNGLETFVMGLAKSEANQAVARKENAAMLMEKNYQNNYDGFNPNSPESNVIFSLYSSAYLKNSILLADKVQKNMVASTHLVNRGVKQAGYWVLYKVAMPSILVEMGFLSNRSDEAYLDKSENRQKIAASIYNAFVDYLSIVTATPAYPHESTNTAGVTQISEAPAPNQDTIIKGTVTPKAEQPQTVTPVLESTGNSIVFKVQFLALPDKLELSDKRLKGLPEVGSYFENGLWKYTAGYTTSHDEIRTILSTVKERYPDAFVIAFQGDKKISEREALKLLKK